VKISKSVTGRKLQLRGELFGVIGAEAFGKILIMNREIKSKSFLVSPQSSKDKRIQSMTNPVKP